MTRIRVGLLSGVRHAREYVEILAGDPAVELVGLAEERDAPDWMVEDSRAVATRAGLPFHLGLEALLDAEQLDVAVVCTEATRHARVAALAVDAGVPVLVDKPVATSLDDALDLAHQAERAGVTVGVVNRNASPALQRVRRAIDAGELGLPLHVDVEWFANGADFATSVERPELVTDPALSGGGELMNFLLYPVDHVRFLTGLDVVEVYCEASTLFGPAHRDAGVEDCAVVSLLLERGVTATVTLGRVPASPGLGPVSSSLRLIGSHGHAVADDDAPAVRRYRPASGLGSLPVGGPSSTAILREVLAGALRDLARGEAPSYSIHEALASLSVTEAAYASVRSGQPEAPASHALFGG